MKYETRVLFRGELMSFKEIGSLVGMRPDTVRSRYKRGLPLDGPKYNPNNLLSRRDGPDAPPRPAYVKFRRINHDITDDSLPYEQDVRAQAFHSYALGGEPLISLQEIAEIKKCDLETAVQYRDRLREHLFRLSSPSLELIGGAMGVSRERVRQIEHRALQKLRNRGVREKDIIRMRECNDDLTAERKVHPYDNPAVRGDAYFGYTAAPSRRRAG